MISMKEIGRICGVAESTVSKALRGHAGIKLATRERIQEVARQYGYQPNAMVECMQTGKSRSIGIACNNFQCQFSGAIMDGIHQALHEYGYHNPVVLIDQVWGSCDFDYVGTDNRAAMAALVGELFERGYRKIGAVLFSRVSSGEERRAGFLDAMFSRSLPVDGRFLCEVTNSRYGNYEQIRNLLKMPDRPEALVCFNDYLANDALNVAYDLGIRVPEELAITGFGNLPLCEKLRPQLTTADQQAETIGRTAARLLLERITGGETGPRREIRLPAQPVLRGSTGSRTVSLLHKPETAGERTNILRASC